MGLYINPETGTKEDWLREHAELAPNPVWPAPDGQTLICHVNNGGFTAAGIVYKEEDFDEFNDPTDFRPIRWYTAPTADVIEVCPLVEDRLTA